ncbi:MAG: sodium:proton antiporter [Acidimicrobiales bacterium]|jgi:NhaP-type Na+/H+ or K+/H+ antiporter
MNHGLDVGALAVAAACVVIWSVCSGRLERLYISAPIAFVAMGLVATHGPLALIHFSPHSEMVKSLAEVTLALVLFTDASRVNIHELRRDVGLPVRLLAIGLPLTIGFGAAAAFGIIPGVSLWVAASVGAIVAPTDAALGAAIMGDTRIPNRIRRLLNVESGLNDGIATPFVNLFLAGAVSTEFAHSTSVLVAAGDLVIGAGVGAAVGLAGGWVLAQANIRGWSAKDFRSMAALGLALFAYSAAIEVHGNGFVAAFVAGMSFGSVVHGDLEPMVGFAEESGGLLSLLVWLIFGAGMVVPGLDRATWQDWLFAILALTVVRMVPVALALLGSGLDRYTVGFVGWFGPRGLASVVFGLIAFDSLDPTDAGRVLSMVTVTVALSVLAHGLSASPLAARYGAYSATLADREPEHRTTPAMRPRTSLGGHVIPEDGGDG